jgi:S-DNA-T family DNA segregation ATPase FtsK/SpoIIIE
MPKKTQPAGDSSFLDWLFYAFVLIALIAAAVWIYAIRDDLTGFFLTVYEYVRDTFGFGIILLLGAIATALFLLLRKHFAVMFRHWYRWLGAAAAALAAWGILAFSGIGGSVGSAIIGPDAAMGGLRIALLFIIAIMLFLPRQVLSLARWTAQRIRDYRTARRERQAAKPVIVKQVKQKPTKEPPPVTVEQTPEITEPKPARQKPAEPAAAPKGLKQIAAEVWKKYGQSSAAKVVDGWRLPPIDILDDTGGGEVSQPDNVQRARRIEEALKSYGVDAKVVQINAGPTVTQFGVEPGWDIKTREVRERDKDGNVSTHVEEVSRTRVKVERITSLANDLALALASPSIRLEAPVPGKSVVGIEVPNTVSGVVSLRSVIETSVFQKLAAKSNLTLALGKGAGGEAGAADLSKMPHLLIAGATGSGKTVCLNASICCLLMQNTPDELRFIMIDPKRVELTPFNSIPHLAAPVIVSPEKAVEALRWLEMEMDKRYQELAKAGERNIDGYNKNRRGKDKMPYLVLVIDELADLMMTGYDEVERILCRLAQLSRAVGIHLIVATQRPSVDVITGLIKANFPTRLSFAVTSQVDSRTILDSVGAEKLLGRGDMLFAPTEAAKPKRLQGCYVSDAETERLVYFWGSQKAEELTQFKIEVAPGAAPAGREPPKDALMEPARKLVENQDQISASFLQRKLQIGYPRAARLKELLDEERAREQKEGPPPVPPQPPSPGPGGSGESAAA